MDNNTPAPGSPAAIIASYQAPQLIENATWTQANNLRKLLDQVNLVDVSVADIVAIQTVPGGAPGAQTTPFVTLRNYGVPESALLNLQFTFKTNPEKMVNVGLCVNQFKNAGTDNFGQPNWIQGFLNMMNVIAIELGYDAFKPLQVPGLLFSIDKIRESAYGEISKYLV